MKFEVCNIRNIKYSFFGDYEFLQATPDNVAKLYPLFLDDHFLPNLITLFHINGSDAAVKVTRPQMVNEEMNCNITFLPERIDIEIKEIEIEKIMEYFDRIINAFGLQVNRLALNSSYKIDITREQMENLRKDMISEKYYPYNDDGVIEWNYRAVARKKCEELNEMVNIGQNIQCSGNINPNGEVLSGQILLDTDINTLAENNDNRFNSLSYRKFFLQANKWSCEILENLEKEMII